MPECEVLFHQIHHLGHLEINKDTMVVGLKLGKHLVELGFPLSATNLFIEGMVIVVKPIRLLRAHGNMLDGGSSEILVPRWI